MKLRWAAGITTLWRCEPTAEMKRSSNRVALKDTPKVPPRRGEMPSPSTDTPMVILKGTVDMRVGMWDESPGWGQTHSASAEVEVAPVDKRATTASDSAYIQMCNEIEQELGMAKLGFQLCRPMRYVRVHHCYNVSIVGTPNQARRGLTRLAANVAQRMVFSDGARRHKDSSPKHTHQKRNQAGAFEARPARWG